MSKIEWYMMASCHSHEVHWLPSTSPFYSVCSVCLVTRMGFWLTQTILKTTEYNHARQPVCLKQHIPGKTAYYLKAKDGHTATITIGQTPRCWPCRKSPSSGTTDGQMLRCTIQRCTCAPPDFAGAIWPDTARSRTMATTKRLPGASRRACVCVCVCACLCVCGMCWWLGCCCCCVV